MDFIDTPTIEKLLEEIDRLKRGVELLEKVHLEIGAYGTGEISNETRNKINDYFNFDDSE